MAQRPDAEPYLVSGRSAAGLNLLRMKQLALHNSIQDAENMQRHGAGLIQRSDRKRFAAVGLIATSAAATALLGVVAASAHDGTYEGALAGNWAMLGCVAGIGGLSFALSWLSSLARLRETGQRLLRRAEYQRKLATLRLTEIEHATVR